MRKIISNRKRKRTGITISAIARNSHSRQPIIGLRDTSSPFCSFLLLKIPETFFSDGECRRILRFLVLLFIEDLLRFITLFALVLSVRGRIKGFQICDFSFGQHSKFSYAEALRGKTADARSLKGFGWLKAKLLRHR